MHYLEHGSCMIDDIAEDVLLAYPLKLAPRYEAKIWGGRRFSDLLSRELPEGPVGESWEVHGGLKVVDGPFKGRTLDSLVGQFGVKLLGERAKAESTFPILTKWLDCKDWLSIQVHPDHILAIQFTGCRDETGKNEAWYIAHREPDSTLIYDLKPGCGVDEVKRMANPKSILDLVCYQAPAKGDLIFISAGIPHALGPGLLVYEIQTSSDLTYRFFDWGRQRALQALEFCECLDKAIPTPYQRLQQGISCSYFEVLTLRDAANLVVGPESFVILAAVEGSWRLRGSFGHTDLAYGESIVFPAGAGALDLLATGHGQMLSITLGKRP